LIEDTFDRQRTARVQRCDERRIVAMKARRISPRTYRFAAGLFFAPVFDCDFPVCGL
jgi:hypothetical protein